MSWEPRLQIVTLASLTTVTVGKVALCVAKGAHGVVFDNLRNGTGWQQRPAELKRGQLNAGQPAPPPPPPPKVTHSQSLKLLSRMLGGSVCGQAAKCAWRLFPRVRAHTHTPTPTHANTHKRVPCFFRQRHSPLCDQPLSIHGTSGPVAATWARCLASGWLPWPRIPSPRCRIVASCE